MEKAPETCCKQCDHKECSTAVERKAECIDEEKIKISCNLRQVRYDAEENYSKNNHRHKEYLHILPHSVMSVLALLVVEKKHQSRNSEEVKKMDSY